MKSIVAILTMLALLVSGCAKPTATETSVPSVDKFRAVSLATSHVTGLNWKGAYVLDSPAKVLDCSGYWEVHFGRPPDRLADPAYGVVRVEKATGTVTVVPQK